MLSKNSKVYIAGHNGMVGSACYRLLKKSGFKKLIVKSSSELNLLNQDEVQDFFKKENPEVVIDAAAKVGGILANNSFPYEFLMENMLIQNNLIRFSHLYDIKKFLFLGSSCIYPKLSKQPIKENYLLTNSLEPTNEWYAIAKISGLKLIESLRKQYSRNYISLMPTNLYGINDNFNLESSHVIPAMIKKFHIAKIKNKKNVVLWGSGEPKREFLHVDDLANAVLFILNKNIDDPFLNVGSGIDLKIKDLAHMIKDIVNFRGKIVWDKSKPDGTPRKLLDISKLTKLGWKQNIKLKDGLIETYNWFKKSNIN